MAQGGYQPVSGSQASWSLQIQRLCVVCCCMTTFLCIGTAAMLHLAPHHVAAGADYVGMDPSVVQSMKQHVHGATDWASGMAQHAHKAGSEWASKSGLDTHMQKAGDWVTSAGQHVHGVGADLARRSGLDVHMQNAGAWVASMGQHVHGVGADMVDSAGLNEHMQRAGEWAQQMHQQLTGQDQILSPYHCSADAGISKWSEAHKVWCCNHHNVACEASTAAPSSAPAQHHYMWISVPMHKGKYDCAAGVKNWLKGWSRRKQKWCCRNKGIGCLHAVSQPFDCSAGSEIGWPSQKKMWCCLHKNRGCPRHSHEVPGDFDCRAGFANWDVGWSVEKQEWCCAHHHHGCAGASSDEQHGYDCTTDLYQWHHRWSDGKKAWCCQTYSLGCADQPTALPEGTYDCDAGYANWRAGWSHDKKVWCCHRASRGCEYDCEAFDELWSSSRQQWCCLHRHRGCHIADDADDESYATSSGVEAPFDCDAGYTNRAVGWSDDKKTWCCRHQGVDCQDR